MGILIEHQESKERKILADAEYTAFMRAQGDERGYWHVVETTTIDPNSAIMRAEIDQKWRGKEQDWEAEKRRLQWTIEKHEKFLLETLESVLGVDGGAIGANGKSARDVLETAIKIHRHTKGAFENAARAACEVLGVKWEYDYGGADPDDDCDDDE